MNTVFVTTCKNREFHLAPTLKANLTDNPNSTFVVLDYGSKENLLPNSAWQSDRLKVYRYETEGPFHVAHAKNMAARLGALEGADVLVTLDADNFAGSNFDQFVAANLKDGVFLCPDYDGIRDMSWDEDRPLRGYAGRLAVRTQDFIKAGGYDEIYDTWRGEDIDFNARMLRMGYQRKFIDNSYLKVIPHSNDVRFKEYPTARAFQIRGGWSRGGYGIGGWRQDDNEEAFYDCASLTNVMIVNSVTNIGEGAFWGCSGLLSVAIPNSVTSLGGLSVCGLF